MGVSIFLKLAVCLLVPAKWLVRKSRFLHHSGDWLGRCLQNDLECVGWGIKPSHN